MKHELPQSWTTGALSQLTKNPKQDIVSGPFGSNLKSDEYVSEGVPIIRLQNVDRNKFLEKNMRFITPQKARELSAHNFQAGDVVITKLGDPLGKACAVRESLPHGIVVADVVRVRIDESRFSRNYALFAINSPAVANQINSEMMGSTRPRVNLNNIRDLQIPLAPLAEQRRIVVELEKMLGQVDACQQRLAKLPTLLKRFRQSVLAAACSGRLTADWREENPTEDAAKLIESVKPSRPVKIQDSSVRSDLDLAEVPESWVWTNLRYLISPAEAFCYGVVQPGENNADGVFLVRAGDLVAGRVDTSSLRRIPRSIHEDYRRSQLLGGEILVTVVGAGIGETAIAQPECAGFNIARAVAKLPIREFEARYVHLWLLTSCAQNWMKGDSREVARPTLNLEQLQTLPVPIPPLAEQQEIVRRVAGLFALADKLELRLAQVRGQVDKLTPSLLARAFAGKLVPQNPADEPASKLLKRITGIP